MSRTLLLNQGYEPVGAISWRRAICLMALGKVEVIEVYDHELRSPSVSLRMPAVVRLLRCFRRFERRVKFSRRNVLVRDGWTCQYCGDQMAPERLTYDHVVPRAQGGRTCWENIVTACIECNARKGNRLPEQAGMRLRGRPGRPHWQPFFTLQLQQEQAIPTAWRAYCYGLRER